MGRDRYRTPGGESGDRIGGWPFWSESFLFDTFDSEFFAAPIARAPKITDVPANTTSTASVAIGSTYVGRVDFSGDTDWIKVSLKAGKTYVIDELGSQGGAPNTLADPLIVGVYNARGGLVSSGNDDWQGGLNAHVEFTPNATGVYYVAASAYGNYQGTYALRVAEKDLIAPTLVSANPTDEATNVSATANIVFNFSEAIRLGSGNITLSDGVHAHVLTGAELSISDKTLTINPSSDLNAGTNYTVDLAQGSILDLSGNAFAGLSTYNFQTAGAPQPPSAGTWNIMIYMAADNNLESFGLYNLNQMESVTLPGNVKITALVDRSPHYSTASGNWTDTRFGFIQHDTNPNVVTSLGTPGTEKNMGDPATLSSFIQNAASLDPAQHNVLLIWDHGGGLYGAAWDDTNGGDNLTVKEMSAAIAASGIHFDMIGFDACLMATVEVYSALAPYCNYFVGSQDLEPGNGWSYDQWLSIFANNPNPSVQDLANLAVSTYAAQYPSDTGIALSAISSAANTQLLTALKNFSDFAVTSTNGDLNIISAAAHAAQNYPYGASENYVDIKAFMALVASNGDASATLRADASAVVAAINQGVISEAGTIQNATGLSIYLPAGNDPVDSYYNPANFDFLSAVPNWDNMLALI